MQNMLGDDQLDDDELLNEDVPRGTLSIPTSESVPRETLPNIPRDPDDPRQKIKDYLQRQGMDRRKDDEDVRNLQKGSSDLGLMALINQSANQMGTLGGKAASSAPVNQYLGQLQGQNQEMIQGIRQNRQQDISNQDKQLKIQQYLADKMQQDKGLDLKRQQIASGENRANQTLDIQKQKLGLMAQKAGKAAGTGEGLKALDRDYAKDYNDWTSTGRATLQKNLDLLNKAKEEIQSEGEGSMLSGRIAGRLPNVLRPEKAIALQQKVQEAAQGALKATLGGQFTEREGQQIMSRSYDPTLSPAENLKKIQEAIDTLQSNAQINDDKARYFEKAQTLQGFKDPRGNIPQESASAPAGAPAAPAGQKPIDQMSLEELQAELGGG